MRFDPHPYQRRAVRWILEHPRCGLFMEMGLGKSVCTLTAVRELMDDLVVGRVLVVAPKKVAESTWSSEAAKWDHTADMRVSVVAGTQAQRLRALRAEADMYVLGRDSVVWLQGLRERPRFDMVVLDELTSFKNHGSQRFKAMRKLLRDVPRVVGLTGTPAPNGLPDLWAQVCCLDNGKRLGPFITHYRRRYFDIVERNNIPIKVTPKPGAEEEILSLISDICFSMRAGDYIDLPPCNVVDRPVLLPDKVRAAYAAFERDRVAEFREATSSGTVTAGSAAALVGKLSQFANGCVYDEEGGEHEVHGAKLEALLEVVEQAGGPVLVFYAYRHDARRILAALPKGTRARVYSDAADLEAWNAGRIDVLLAHPASTAYGLNMQAGGHVIVWFSTGWNLELYQQANARLHRQGQRHTVTVCNLIAAGTVDERMAAAIRDKDTRQDSVVRRLAMDISGK